MSSNLLERPIEKGTTLDTDILSYRLSQTSLFRFPRLPGNAAFDAYSASVTRLMACWPLTIYKILNRCFS